MFCYQPKVEKFSNFYYKILKYYWILFVKLNCNKFRLDWNPTTDWAIPGLKHITKPVYLSSIYCLLIAGVSNSKGLAGCMRLKVRSCRPHENKNFELCVKNQFIWEIKENNSIFHFKSWFFLMFTGRIGPSLGPRV